MDDEDKPGSKQIPLLEDIVFDPEMALKPPPRPAASRKVNYSSKNYDPDTRDLFDIDEDDPDLGESIADELRQNADEFIDELVDEYAEELRRRLRAELTEQLTAILDHLEDPDDKT